MFASGLATPPTITVTGWTPSGEVSGIVQLICVTPTDQLGIPIKNFAES